MSQLIRIFVAVLLICSAAESSRAQSGALGTGPLPVGSIIAFGGRLTPAMEAELVKAGWLPCDGRALATATSGGAATPYVNLFKVIGINYGAGYNDAGVKVGIFNVPDFRGQFLRGVSGSSRRDPDAAARTAMQTGGFVGNEVGSVQGHATARHGHAATASLSESNGVFVSRPVGQSELPDGLSPGYSFSDGGASGITRRNIGVGVAVQQSGGNETRPINAYVNWIIKYK